MPQTVPWNSQPLKEWTDKHAPGKIIELNGRTTHYIEKGSGPPLILIHGFFFDSYMWHKNIDSLAQYHKVYAFDLWGVGYSTRDPLEHNYPLYTEQLRLFMDALNIQKASLVGQSMGAGTIINFTVSNPERVDKLILVDPAGLPNPLPIMGRIANLPKLGEFMFQLNGPFMRKMTLGNTFLHRKEQITEEFLTNATRFFQIKGTSEIMLQITRKQFFDTLSEQITTLGSMDIPILLVWGRNEKAIPLPIGRKMAKILHKAQFEILDEAGHCPNIDQPDQFNQLALNFLGTG